MGIQVYAKNRGAVRLSKQTGYEIRARAKGRPHPCQPYCAGGAFLQIKTLSFRLYDKK